MAILFKTHNMENMNIDEGNRLLINECYSLKLINADLRDELLDAYEYDPFDELQRAIEPAAIDWNGPTAIIADSWDDITD